MREIKFRAWDNQNKYWITQDCIVINGTGYLEIYDAPADQFNSANSGEVTLTQFTGLKDKNGREIYLSDLIHTKDGVCLVVWSDKFASFGLDKKGWAFLHYFGEAIHPLECEVIGNIYENPELLKGKGE